MRESIGTASFGMGIWKLSELREGGEEVEKGR